MRCTFLPDLQVCVVAASSPLFNAMLSSVYAPLHPEPSSLDDIQRFITNETELEKPLVFAKKSAFTNYISCGEPCRVFDQTRDGWGLHQTQTAPLLLCEDWRQM